MRNQIVLVGDAKLNPRSLRYPSRKVRGMAKRLAKHYLPLPVSKPRPDELLPSAIHRNHVICPLSARVALVCHEVPIGRRMKV